jgi:hypothetical protein
MNRLAFFALSFLLAGRPVAAFWEYGHLFVARVAYD